MQVTCESCGARYKLDSSRFSGRGARITCPRCQHVFLVYREGENGEDVPEEEMSTAQAESMSPTYHVDELDFRKVGIQAWKVKVKIGLVYDFSDYKTLSKYITDGRVTTADKISHDGKKWTEIGTIPDLAQHFIDVYVNAERAQNESASPAVRGVGEFDGDEPTDIFGLQQAEKAKADLAEAVTTKTSQMSPPAARNRPAGPGPGVDDELMNMARNLSADMATGEAEPSGPPRFVDPFEARKRKKRVSASHASDNISAGSGSSAKTEKSGGASKILLIGLFSVAACAGIYVYQSMQEEPGQAQVTAKNGGGKAGEASSDLEETKNVEDPPSADSEDSESISAVAGFSTGEGSTDPAYVPACQVRGDCGQNAGSAPSTQGGAGTATTGTPDERAKAAFVEGKNQLRRGKRTVAAKEFGTACELQPAVRKYCVEQVQALLFMDNRLEECSSASNQAKAKAVLDGLEQHGDFEYLRGQYWDLCQGDFEKATPHFQKAAVGSSNSKWREYANDWIATSN